MELTVSSLRFLLSPQAMKSAMQLLALPLFPGMEEGAPEEQEAGRAWLAENGFLSRPEGEKPTLSREIAFMLTGLCRSEDALIWQEGEKAVMIACRFENIFLLCRKMRIGKWEITPFAESAEWEKEMDERLPMPDKTQLFRRGEKAPLPAAATGAQSLQRMMAQKEA